MDKTASNSTGIPLPPLAERIRPVQLSDFIGQPELTGTDSVFVRALEQNQLFSVILWGPPGSGKTTLAKILARTGNSDYYELSAVSAGVADVRKILEQGRTNLQLGMSTVLFIDEIHRFSKSQQDALLHGVEHGVVILIGATTENPSFEVISPLLSRCRVFKLYAHDEQDLYALLDRAIREDSQLNPLKIQFEGNARELLVQSCGGDARKLLNTLELAVSLHDPPEITVLPEDIHQALQRKEVLYDKAGDYHYDTISAFIKTVRGSDPDAALYWLAVMLEGGEQPEFIARRLIILAVEDVGNADPYALVLANAGMQAVHSVGMPESRIILAQITTYLAGVPKSNAAYQGIDKAQKYVRENGAQPVPLHLRNAPTRLMKDMNYGQGYQYPHDHPGHFIPEHYFPETIPQPPVFYRPTDLGREKNIKERLAHIWKKRYA